jgi:uncharacterized protein YjbI with pentapeptide repeats
MHNYPIPNTNRRTKSQKIAFYIKEGYTHAGAVAAMAQTAAFLAPLKQANPQPTTYTTGDAFLINRYHRTNFANCNLAGINIANATLIGLNFTNANLAGVNFTNCTLKNCIFTNANLTGANFTGAFAVKPYFAGANLTGANFNFAHFVKANFYQANLTNIFVQGAKMPQIILNNYGFTCHITGKRTLCNPPPLAHPFFYNQVLPPKRTTKK